MSRLTRDGTAEPVSRDQTGTYGDKGIFIVPVQLTTSMIDNLTRLIHTLLYAMTIHAYKHTYINCVPPPFFSFFFFHLTYSRWTSSLPSCLWSQRIFPSLPGSRLTIFLSRCKFSTLTTRQPMVEFYLLTFPRFPLRKKEHKSYFGKSRTHDFRTSRCAAYLLDHSGDEQLLSFYSLDCLSWAAIGPTLLRFFLIFTQVSPVSHMASTTLARFLALLLLSSPSQILSSFPFPSSPPFRSPLLSFPSPLPSPFPSSVRARVSTPVPVPARVCVCVCVLHINNRTPTIPSNMRRCQSRMWSAGED